MTPLPVELPSLWELGDGELGICIEVLLVHTLQLSNNQTYDTCVQAVIVYEAIQSFGEFVTWFLESFVLASWSAL